MLFSVVVPGEKQNTKRFAAMLGPSLVTDRDFVEDIVRLRNNGETHIVLSLAKNLKTTASSSDEVHSTGVLARIDAVEELSYNSTKSFEVLLTVTRRVLIVGPSPKNRTKKSRYPRVIIKELEEHEFNKDSKMSRALFMSIASTVQELCKLNHPLFQDQIQFLSYKINDREPGELADLCASLCFWETPSQLQVS